MVPGVQANVGFDYRSDDSGTIYLGLTYKRPFSNMYTSTVNYNTSNTLASMDIVGGYFTVDVRYFFPLTKNGEALREYE